MFRVAAAVFVHCAGRREHAAAGQRNGLPLNALVRGPGGRIGRVVVLGHRIAEIGQPGQAASPVQFGADAVRRGDRIGAPDRLRPVALDHLHAYAHRVEAPGGPTVWARQPTRVSARKGQVAGRVKREGAPHHQVVRKLRHQVVAGFFVGLRLRAEHQGLPAETG